MANQYKNKIVYNGTILLDLSGDTVTLPEHIMAGFVGHLSDGRQVTGTGQGGGTAAISVVDTEDSHGGTIRTVTALDISDTTAVAADVAQGKYFYTAQGIKTLGTASEGSGSSGQTVTGTVTGTGTDILEIPCSFEPDLIYVHSDLSDDATKRGVVSITIIKDRLIDMHSDPSTSAASESMYYASHDVTGYNENDDSNPHASYANGVLTITSINSSATRFLSGQVYNYELSTIGTGGSGSSATLITKNIDTNGTYSAQDDSADGYSSVTVNVPSSGITPTGSINITTNGTYDVTNYASAVVNVPTGGSTPSATSHTILFEFTDETSATITAYYDSSFISDAIRATTPTEYSGKTVDSASLDGVAWYTRPTETWETLYDGNIQWMPESNGDYPYCWISDLSNIPITVGSVWRVTYNNTEYRCTGKIASLGGQNYNVFGNPVWSGGTDDGSGVPFIFVDYTNYSAWSGGLNVPNAESNYYFKIERLVTS
jgi:hypothetical protein